MIVVKTMGTRWRRLSNHVPVFKIVGGCPERSGFQEGLLDTSFQLAVSGYSCCRWRGSELKDSADGRHSPLFRRIDGDKRGQRLKAVFIACHASINL